MIKVIYYLVNRAIRSVLQERIPSGFREPVKNAVMMNRIMMGIRNHEKREDGKRYSKDLIFPLSKAVEQKQDIIPELCYFSMEMIGEEIVKITSPITPLTLQIEFRDLIRIIEMTLELDGTAMEIGMEIILPDEDEVGEERTIQLFLSCIGRDIRFNFLVKDILINEKLIDEYRVSAFVNYDEADKLFNILSCLE